MYASTPLETTDPSAGALYEYLVSLEPGNPNPVPFTVVSSIDPLARGNADNGQALFAKACFPCHGAMHSGEGRLGSPVPILPDEIIASHSDFTPRVQRLVFIEKIRHGLFLDYGGDMPPFSAEVLSDQDVSDILEALGVTGE
jgi:thiosulfate dehydrogenase